MGRSAVRVGLLFAGAVPVLVARPDFEYEYVLKAQILVELLPYVQWPPAPTPPTGPFIIGVYGRSPFGPSLDAYARTRTIQRRPIAIRYVTRLEDLAGCDAVFISPSEASHADQVVAWARGRRVLTVADAGSALRQGVMVALLLEGDFVRLVVNLEVAQAQGLAFGSLLLRNARIVKSGSKLP